jgi:predicted DsbA family dithiol-disulfide isomerase
MHIDIFSDTICPWCYIGKRRLERALAERPQEDLTIRWRAFQLNPDMPQEGMDRQTYLDLKFGGRENAERVYGAVKQAGKEENLSFRIEAIQHTPNTLESHRLLSFAAEHGCQDALLERLFEAYFVNGRDIGNRAVLQELAVASGLDEAEVAGFLDSDEGLEAAAAEDQLARRHGIQGVPTYIFNGRYAVSGAQQPEVFFQMFDLAREGKSTQANPS